MAFLTLIMPSLEIDIYEFRDRYLGLAVKKFFFVFPSSSAPVFSFFLQVFPPGGSLPKKHFSA